MEMSQGDHSVQLMYANKKEKKRNVRNLVFYLQLWPVTISQIIGNYFPNNFQSRLEIYIIHPIWRGRVE
jgi:hypothetical protein